MISETLADIRPARVAVNRDGTFLSIQVLRGIAAILVTIFHAGQHFDPAETTFRIGNAGVDIFFVISGFVMWTVTARRPTSPATFLRHRFVRLVPLYWLFTLLMVGGEVLVPAAFPRVHPIDWHVLVSHVLPSLLFIPHVSPDNVLPLPVLAQGWTLNFEVFFYVMFAIVLALPAQRRLVAIAAALIALPLAHAVLPVEGVPVATLLSPLLIEFLAGIAIARLVVQGCRPGSLWGSAGLALGIVLLLTASPGRDDDLARLLQYGVPATLIVGGAVAIELSGRLRVGRLPLLLGGASYSIYIVHTLAISLIGKAWPAFLPPTAFLVAATLFATLAGIATYLCVEQPLLNWMRPNRPATLVSPLAASS
jgi:exopolysaccharide production protein ExoZ